MDIKQINLKLPQNFVDAAENYAKNFGFRNIQELAAASMREKIFRVESPAERELGKTIFADEKLLAENWLSEEDNEAWKDL